MSILRLNCTQPLKLAFCLSLHSGWDVMGVVPLTVKAYPSLSLPAVSFICAYPCSKDCEIDIFDLSKSWKEYNNLKYSSYNNYEKGRHGSRLDMNAWIHILYMHTDKRFCTDAHL